MPRLTATKPMARAALTPARPAPARRPAKKPATLPDRLSARALFFRRLRRSLRPGIWICVILIALAGGAELFRAIPKLGPVISPVGSVRHGLAVLAGYAGFRVTDIQIIGAETTKPAAIDTAIGIKAGEPIFALSLAAMQARLEQLGPVQTATVTRALPGTLIVTIKERNGFAIWQTGSADSSKTFQLIDGQGNVISNQDAAAAKRRDPSLLLLAGADAPLHAQSLISELQGAPGVLPRVAAAERVDGLRWNLILKNDTLIKLPADDEQKAIAQLAALQASMALLDRPVEVIDLRFAGKMVVRPYPSPDAPTPVQPNAGAGPARTQASRT